MTEQEALDLLAAEGVLRQLTELESGNPFRQAVRLVLGEYDRRGTQIAESRLRESGALP